MQANAHHLEYNSGNATVLTKIKPTVHKMGQVKLRAKKSRQERKRVKNKSDREKQGEWEMKGQKQRKAYECV